MKKPKIGIASDRTKRVKNYQLSVEDAGGEVSVLLPESYTIEALKDLDGLLLTGGGDIDACQFGEANHPRVYGLNPARDEMELGLTIEAQNRGIPVFGICRGLQIMNVALGGTLIQDIPDELNTPLVHYDKDPRQNLVHEVTIAEGTILHGILGKTRIGVNSFHHQSIKTLGRGLIKTAWSDDGVIEAIEIPKGPLFLGVQWHPEEFVNHGGAFRPLFQSFVEAAGRS